MNDIFPSKRFAKWATVQIRNDPSTTCKSAKGRDIERCKKVDDAKVTEHQSHCHMNTKNAELLNMAAERCIYATFFAALFRKNNWVKCLQNWRK